MFAHYARANMLPRCLAVLLAVVPLIEGQAQPPRTAARVAQATRTERPPRLDGTLDDPIWSLAPRIADFRQREPLETLPATEKTEVYILYDARHVYFGVHCYDSHPEGIIASELRRDLSQDLDDHFAVLIDSNHNRRGGYVFEINPLGTQNDGLVVEEQSGYEQAEFDRGWDGVWTSEA